MSEYLGEPTILGWLYAAPAVEDDRRDERVPGVNGTGLVGPYRLKSPEIRSRHSNGINHPNDFGPRLSAQVILALLVGPSALA